MADYKVYNKCGCKHMDPKGWKFEQHKCYVQKEWREGCVIEDLVSLKCLHCHSLLEKQPKTMQQIDYVAIAMEGVQVCCSDGQAWALSGGVDGGRKGVFCPNLYSPLCTSSSMNSKIWTDILKMTTDILKMTLKLRTY